MADRSRPGPYCCRSRSKAAPMAVWAPDFRGSGFGFSRGGLAVGAAVGAVGGVGAVGDFIGRRSRYGAGAVAVLVSARRMDSEMRFRLRSTSITATLTMSPAFTTSRGSFTNRSASRDTWTRPS
jgi:hypothetical protein